MSSTQRRTRRVTCFHCGTKYDTEAGLDEYCSERCRLTARGERALRDIAQDHRFCSSCYKPLKVVFRPDDSDVPKLREKAVVIRDSFVGYQTFTKYARSGSYGVECQCGNCQHYHSEPFLRDMEPYEDFLKLCFTKFREEGQRDDVFDRDTFTNTYEETDEFELAVGKALD